MRIVPCLGIAWVVVCSAFLAAAGGAEGTESWPQWRGPTRDGQLLGPAWPDKLQGNLLTPLWRVEMGPSYSGPIVTPTSIFVTETRGNKEEVVRALDHRTGREIWSTTWPGSVRVPFFAASNGSWIRSTPAWDGECLYVAGMRDVLVCLDGATGKERWRVDFVESLKTPLPDFGFVCSPLVVGDELYVQAGASFAKLDKRTGRILWRTLQDEGGMWGSAFSSPILATLRGTPQLIVQTRTTLAGVAPDDGRVLWSQKVPAFRGMNILTPVVWGNCIFTSSYGGSAFLFQINRADGGFSVETLWKAALQGYMSTPVIIDGHAYLHLRNQRFTCIDLKTGKASWTTPPFGKYWSLIAHADRILALDERGELLLIRATPEKFDLLDRRSISESPTWAHLAISGDELFIRELDAIAAYRWRTPPP